MHRPIPVAAGQVKDWKKIPIKEEGCFDPLVPLGALSQEAGNILTSSVYFGEHSSSPYAEAANALEGSFLTLFARRSVARRLLVAQDLLPAGYHLMVFDAYRSYRVQKSLHDVYKKKLKQKTPDLDNEALESETQKYVSLPSTDLTRPSPHNTGGAVDVVIVKLNQIYTKELQHIRTSLAKTNLDTAKQIEMELRLWTLVNRHSKMLDFGTAFDHGGEKSALTYYESKLAAGKTLTTKEKQACDNRRLLYWVMTQAGFQPYFAEWWHFNAPESQMGAATLGLNTATFGAATLDESNRVHEDLRRKIYQKIPKRRSEKTPHWPTEIIAP